ncbi:MAG TPA: hypothetical protein DCZ13_14065, partial [Porticoccaceae bacterium]|nr:hypothetical protein [Porticoccaceae bacterium]
LAGLCMATHAAQNCNGDCDPLEKPESPYQLIVDNTERVLTLARSARSYFQDDPERYFKQVSEIVDSLVDTERFTRGVMATYASPQRYQALTSGEEKAHFQARINYFGSILKHDLIYTYAKALLDFADERIETLPPARDAITDKSARIEQKIYRPGEAAHLIQYSLYRAPGESWKLYNVIVDGINIGHIFRNQFAYAVEKYRGNIDQAIANWSTEQTVDNWQENKTNP